MLIKVLEILVLSIAFWVAAHSFTVFWEDTN